MSEASALDREVARTLLSASSVVVCAHVNPDGDAVGAVIALALALRAAGVDAVPTLADEGPAPSTYAFLEGFDLLRPARDLEAPEVFVALDTPTWSRLGRAEALGRAAQSVVVMDHHVDNARFGTVSLVDPGAASTGSIVWRLLPLLGIVADPAIATACYTALVTDTGRFSYGNTNPTAFRDAADMLGAGADAFRVYSRVYETRSPGALSLLGRVLSRITLANSDRIAYSWIEDGDLAETGALPDETENLVDVVRQVRAVDAVVLFKSGSDGVRVSLRAKCPTLDVGAVARHFGGGGHAAASGATLAGTLEDAVPAVLSRLPGASK